MDPRHAQASLDEVRTRERQIADVVARDGSPWWYVGGIAAAFMAVAVSSDLDDRWGTGWIGAIFDYGVPAVGIAGIGGLAMAMHRSMRVRPRHYSAGVRRATMWLAVAFLVVFIGLGTALRAAEVSWASTISGAAATLVFIGGSLLLRRAALAEAAPRRPRVD
jgi:preprotein translocase subunit SecG